jgi:hypothetical protein
MLMLSCNETSPLLGHNQAFLDMYAIPSADMLEARGVVDTPLTPERGVVLTDLQSPI